MLIICILSGIFLLFPTLNYQDLLGQGDHGRDLYCFAQTAHGGVPYRDYWWEYGPLMPYYYGAFFKALGLGIQNILLGQAILVLLSGICLYLTALLIMSPGLALAVALFFWVFRPESFYTYNHIGGTLFQIFICYCFFRHISSSTKRFFYLGLLGVFALNLVRLNIGFACLLAFLISLALNDAIVPRKNMRKEYLLGFLVVSLATMAIYMAFTLGLSLPKLKQCFPYLGSYRPDTATPFQSIYYFWKVLRINFTATWIRQGFGLILAFATGHVLYLFIKDKMGKEQKAKAFVTIWGLLIFLVFNFHEFLVSSSLFRISWFFPFGILLILFMIHLSLQFLPKVLAYIVISALIIVNILGGWDHVQKIMHNKNEGNLFHYGPTQIYVNNNHPTGETLNPWIKTVTDATDHLKSLTKDNPIRPILALPYDSLYLFLSERTSASYILAYFSYTHISPAEEQAMILEMERLRVSTVLLSNRAYSHDPELGIFGTNYCPLLAAYLHDHFKTIATYGEWEKPPGFVENHAVQILSKTNYQGRD